MFIHSYNKDKFLKLISIENKISLLKFQDHNAKFNYIILFRDMRTQRIKIISEKNKHIYEILENGYMSGVRRNKEAQSL